VIEFGCGGVFAGGERARHPVGGKPDFWGQIRTFGGIQTSDGGNGNFGGAVFVLSQSYSRSASCVFGVLPESGSGDFGSFRLGPVERDESNAGPSGRAGQSGAGPE